MQGAKQSLEISSAQIAAVMRDRASVNNKAIDTLLDGTWPSAINITCISHALDNVGMKFQV